MIRCCFCIWISLNAERAT
uniref:Ftsj, putative n=1 Tax=Arundo donax TaxID=35708 RepID=A0A0A9BDW7_ARUDO